MRTLTTTAAEQVPYAGRHRETSPTRIALAASRAFVRVLGVGLMYRGRHRDDSPEARQRDLDARPVIDAKDWAP